MKNKGSKESVSVRFSIKNICKKFGLGKMCCGDVLFDFLHRESGLATYDCELSKK